MNEKIISVDHYISSFEPHIRELLERVRTAIHAGISDAGAEESAESMSYGIVRISINGRYGVYFGAWKHHIGLYPIPHFDGELEEKLSPYRAAKDSAHFPYAMAMPDNLITEVAAEIARRTLAQ